MAHVTLQTSGINASVNQRITSAVPQHVRVNRQMFKARFLGHFPNHNPNRNSAERLATFAHKKRVDSGWHTHASALSQPAADACSFAVVHRMRTGDRAFETVTIDFTQRQVNVGDFQLADF